MEGGGTTMISTIGTYVTQMFSWVGDALTDTDIQPFILLVTAVGVTGAIVGLAKRVARIGGGRRR